LSEGKHPRKMGSQLETNNGEIEITMRREFLAVVLLAVATTSSVRAEGTNAPGTNAPPAVAPAPAGKLQFDKTVYDFGPTALVDSVTGTFTFQNTGAGDLKIEKPQPSCGCTVASVKPDSLKPGEKGELVFTVRVAGQRGQLEKHITVPSNDPQAGKVSLSIKIEMKQIIDVTPQNIQLGNIQQGTTTNVTVLVHRTDGKKLVISKAESSNKLLHARVEPVAGSNDQSANVVLEIESEGVPRQFSENVKLSLEDIAQPVAVITLNGRLLGAVLVDPVMLYWPITDASSTNSEALPAREIKVSAARPDQPVEIKNLTTNVKDLNLELVTKDAGKSYVVVAKFAAIPKQSVQGVISFETSASSQKNVTVPVTVTVLRK
jgi:Protein of unknown function (DUF1573)